MLIKLDLSKDFDRIRWKYMISLLEAFGFDNLWVTSIMQITSLSLFSILFNGVHSQPFSPTRGIQQGDPLSPFLFVIMAEVMGRYIKASVEDGSHKGLQLHNLQPTPSHSQFINHTLLLNTPMAQEANKLKIILTDFVKASGASLNLNNFPLYFFNTPIEIQNHISQLLDIPNSSLSSNYLGVPLTGASTCKLSWDNLLISISNRLSN
jgi:hypothetical protein